MKGFQFQYLDNRLRDIVHPKIYLCATVQIMNQFCSKCSLRTAFASMLYMSLVSLSACFTELSAQVCLTDVLNQRLLASSDSIQASRQRHLQDLNIILQEEAVHSRQIFEIPIVFHVVYKDEVGNVSDEAIYRQVDILNRDFGYLNTDKDKLPNEFQGLGTDTGIRFCLAYRDGTGTPRKGINRVKTDVDTIGVYFPRGDLSIIPLFHESLGGAQQWTSHKYLNVFVADLGENLLGYAFYPGTSSRSYDNVVVNYRCFSENNHPDYGLGRTLVHEIAHHFDLIHIWGEETGCTSDDGVADTPRQFGPHFGCDHQNQESCESRDLYFNHMNYVSDECSVMFTRGQAQRMRASLLTYNRFSYHHNNWGCEEKNARQACSELSIHPNPVTNGFLNVTFLTEDYGYMTEANVFDSMGRLMYRKLNLDGSHLAIPVQGFASGVYTLLVKCHAGVEAKKFIVP